MTENITLMNSNSSHKVVNSEFFLRLAKIICAI